VKKVDDTGPVKGEGTRSRDQLQKRYNGLTAEGTTYIEGLCRVLGLYAGLSPLRKELFPGKTPPQRKNSIKKKISEEKRKKKANRPEHLECPGGGGKPRKMKNVKSCGVNPLTGHFGLQGMVGWERFFWEGGIQKGG